MLDALPLPSVDPEPDVPRHEGVFSVVVDDRNKKVRSLPSLFHGMALVFADRNLSNVLRRLRFVVDVVKRASNQSIYALQPCELDGRQGFYGRDFYNRSSYRMKLRRLGMRFADDPYVRFTPGGTFESDEWGRLEPRFAVLFDDMPDPAQLGRTRGALLPFRFASFRLGKIQPLELHRLRETAPAIQGISAGDESAVVDAIKKIQP